MQIAGSEPLQNRIRRLRVVKLICEPYAEIGLAFVAPTSVEASSMMAHSSVDGDFIDVLRHSDLEGDFIAAPSKSDG